MVPPTSLSAFSLLDPTNTMSRFVRFAVLVAAWSLLLTVPRVEAQTDGIGLGASIGVTNGPSVVDRNPIGFNAKAWVSDRQAVSGMTSFFIGGTAQSAPSYWVVQGDYLFFNFNELEVGEGYLALYTGGGGQYTVFEDQPNQFALRAPFGVNYLLGSSPIDVFVEIAPALRVTDPASLRFDGAIGFRYFFSSDASSDGS